MIHRWNDDGSTRVVAQFLEGGVTVAMVDPDAAVTRLETACQILPISDVCLGWRLPTPLLEPVTEAARALGCKVWLWHPLLSGDGDYVPATNAARRSDGEAVPAPFEMPEFGFDCPVRSEGIGSALTRLQAAMGTIAWDGVFLDKIRWPSPTRDPAQDLACFCDACRTAAADAHIDLDAIAQHLAEANGTARGRLGLLEELLGLQDHGVLAPFLAWRAGRISLAVQQAAELIADTPARDGGRTLVALDVFAPSLAWSVGQDIAALAPASDFTKSMMYLGTHGPAGLPFELCQLVRWLQAGGVADAATRLGTMLGYDIDSRDGECADVLPPGAFEAELAVLTAAAGAHAAAGIDAITLPGLAVADDETLAAATRAAVAQGVTIVISWDLWSTPPERLWIMAEAVGHARRPSPTA